MTLRHMKIFVVVCKEKSITLAARKLYISQPAVSNAIKELENFYGTPLFDRISKKIYLTVAGDKLYPYALHIVSLFEESETSLKNADASGQLKIGSSLTIGTHLMPDYIREFTSRCPLVKAFVTIDSSDIIEQMVLNNELDFALIEGLVHSQHIVSEDFIHDELVVICDVTNPLLKKEIIIPEDIANLNFLMREKNSGTRELADSVLNLHNISITPLWESSSSEAIIRGVSKGIGISILPFQIVQDYIEKGIVAQLFVDDLSFPRQYHVIYHKNKFLTPALLEFMKICHTFAPISI